MAFAGEEMLIQKVKIDGKKQQIFYRRDANKTGSGNNLFKKYDGIKEKKELLSHIIFHIRQFRHGLFSRYEFNFEALASDIIYFIFFGNKRARIIGDRSEEHTS